MKKLLTKIRSKKLRGNVSLLVILILLASSVISLLSINQIQRLMTYGNMTSNYFRAFYIAKAGTELWLTEVYNRWNGFNQVLSGDFITTWNFLSGYEWFEPHFNMTITGSFATLTNDVRNSECNDENKIRLTSWAWIMLSLFSDKLSKSDSSIKEILSDYSWVNALSDNNIKSIKLISQNWLVYLTFWLFDYDDDWNMSNIFVETWYNLETILDHLDDEDSYGKKLEWKDRKYLTIKNPGTWNEVAEFCITMSNEPIPYSDSLITVFWHYGDMEVWLQSIVKKWVPDWTLNVLDEQPSSN